MVKIHKNGTFIAKNWNFLSDMEASPFEPHISAVRQCVTGRQMAGPTFWGKIYLQGRKLMKRLSQVKIPPPPFARSFSIKLLELFWLLRKPPIIISRSFSQIVRKDKFSQENLHFSENSSINFHTLNNLNSHFEKYPKF